MVNAITPQATPLASIDARAVERYQEDGFLFIPDLFDPGVVKSLREEAVAICRGERGEVDGTEEQILDASAANSLSDEELIARVLCLHHPHKISETIRDVVVHERIASVLTQLIGPNVKAMQSMYFIKAAGKPGQAWHQDEDFIPTRDRSLIGVWIALDDATVDNGCLWVIPGSHKKGILWPQYAHNDDRFDCTFESYDFPYTAEDEVPVEVPAGGALFFHGYLLHRSLPNRRETGFRRTLVNHYMSAESLLPWRPQEGVPVAKTDFRDILMVAGKDPYAFRGQDDTLSRAHVRKAGQGGCGDGRVDLPTHREEVATGKRRAY